MSKNQVFRYIKAKGFYIALAVCIVGASATAWTLANRTLESIDRHNGQLTQEPQSREETPWSVAPTPAEGRQEDIIKPSPPPPSSSSASESSAGSVTKPVDSSAAQVLQPVQQQLSYQWPIQGGEVLTPYSAGQLVKNKTLNVWRAHDALDIGGGEGAVVLAVGDAVVADISTDPLWGGRVLLDHPDGHRTAYSGLKADPKLKVGQQVKAGAPLGIIDQIPAEVSMPPHIHLEMTKKGVAVDPTQLLQP